MKIMHGIASIALVAALFEIEPFALKSVDALMLRPIALGGLYGWSHLALRPHALLRDQLKIAEQVRQQYKMPDNGSESARDTAAIDMLHLTKLRGTDSGSGSTLTQPEGDAFDEFWDSVLLAEQKEKFERLARRGWTDAEKWPPRAKDADYDSAEALKEWARKKRAARQASAASGSDGPNIKDYMEEAKHEKHLIAEWEKTYAKINSLLEQPDKLEEVLDLFGRTEGEKDSEAYVNKLLHEHESTIATVNREADRMWKEVSELLETPNGAWRVAVSDLIMRKPEDTVPPLDVFNARQGLGGPEWSSDEVVVDHQSLTQLTSELEELHANIWRGTASEYLQAEKLKEVLTPRIKSQLIKLLHRSREGAYADFMRTVERYGARYKLNAYVQDQQQKQLKLQRRSLAKVSVMLAYLYVSSRSSTLSSDQQLLIAPPVAAPSAKLPTWLNPSSPLVASASKSLVPANWFNASPAADGIQDGPLRAEEVIATADDEYEDEECINTTLSTLREIEMNSTDVEAMPADNLTIATEACHVINPAFLGFSKVTSNIWEQD